MTDPGTATATAYEDDDVTEQHDEGDTPDEGDENNEGTDDEVSIGGIGITASSSKREQLRHIQTLCDPNMTEENQHMITVMHATIKKLTAQCDKLRRDRDDKRQMTWTELTKIETPFWYDHKDFPPEMKNIPGCTTHPKINMRGDDNAEEARVRIETEKLWNELEAGDWYFPEESAGSFCNMPAEVLIQILRFARSPEHALPWNAMDLHKKVHLRPCDYLIVLLIIVAPRWHWY